MVTFKLLMTKFRYPSPCTDAAPNGVQLTVSGNTPLAYYAPLANTNWPGFNVTSMSFTTTAGETPVWSLKPNQLTKVTACVNITGRESLQVVWRQDNFTSDNDYWYLYIKRVSLGKTNISDIGLGSFMKSAGDKCRDDDDSGILVLTFL